MISPHIPNLMILPLSVDNEGGEIVKLVVILVMAFGSAIVGWIKKQQDAKSQEGKAPPPAPPQAPQRPWPPVGTTTGTTIPGPARPTPPRVPQQRPAGASPTQRPPVARPVPASGKEESMRERAERVEAEMRRRAEQAGQQMQQKSSQTRQEAQDKIDKVREKSAAAERIRLAAEKARRAAEQAQQAATTDAVRTKQDASHLIVPGDAQKRSYQMPERLRALLAEPSWRAGIIMAEILSPPVALRDPNAQTGTVPPSLA